MSEENTKQTEANKEDLWRLDNYILLKDYLDRTISRIAARCVRSGNIAIEEYPFYGYIIDVLDEICDTGDYLLQRAHLNPLIEQKITGGREELKKRIADFKSELLNNSTSAMIRNNEEEELARAKEALGGLDFDPTKGAGMSIDDVVAKLANEHNQDIDNENQAAQKSAPVEQPIAEPVAAQPVAPQPAVAQPIAPTPQAQPTAPVQPVTPTPQPVAAQPTAPAPQPVAQKAAPAAQPAPQAPTPQPVASVQPVTPAPQPQVSAPVAIEENEDDLEEADDIVEMPTQQQNTDMKSKLDDIFNEETTKPEEI